jgi:hypothetical protein
MAKIKNDCSPSQKQHEANSIPHTCGSLFFTGMRYQTGNSATR